MISIWLLLLKSLEQFQSNSRQFPQLINNYVIRLTNCVEGISLILANDP